MKMQSDNAMISVELDADMLRMIDKALSGVKSESRKVLKKAINATAKQAKADLISKAKEEYTIKKTVLSKAPSKKNATVSDLEATIEVKSETRELRDFKTSVPRQGAKAQILTSGSLKLIQSKKGSRAKAFPGHLRKRPQRHRSEAGREAVQDCVRQERPAGEVGQTRRHDADQKAARHFGPEDDRRRKEGTRCPTPEDLQ